MCMCMPVFVCVRVRVCVGVKHYLYVELMLIRETKILDIDYCT